MSMINDALRRASAARGASAPPPPPPPLPPAEQEYQQAEPPPPSPASAFAAPPPLAMHEDSLPPGLEPEEQESPRGNKVQLVLAVLLVFAVGAVAVLNHLHKKKEGQVVDVSVNVGSKKILPNANAIQSAAQTLSAITNRAAAATAPLPVATATPAVAAPATPVPPPKFPPLRLQSIFYRPSNPSVMINGRTLFLDDEIQGVIVADIHPSSVTLVLSGHTNILTLR